MNEWMNEWWHITMSTEIHCEFYPKKTANTQRSPLHGWFMSDWEKPSCPTTGVGGGGVKWTTAQPYQIVPVQTCILTWKTSILHYSWKDTKHVITPARFRIVSAYIYLYIDLYRLKITINNHFVFFFLFLSQFSGFINRLFFFLNTSGI